MTKQIRNTFLNQIIPLVLGSATFFLVLGWQPLQVDNIAWLQESVDSTQHYIGWLFFRNTQWTFPFGANPNYGMEIGSSIFYSDSIPLLAIVFKLLSNLLPVNFQYVGLWLLLCFVLQAWFAWRLIGQICQDTFVKICATGLFLFSPPMLNRLCGHDTLVGHWLILAGLYFCLSKDIKHKMWKWLTLVLIASLVHSYFLAMVICLWLCDTFRRLIISETKLQTLLFEYILVIGVVLLSLWQVGFFLIEPSATQMIGNRLGHFTLKPETTAYGYYRFNLISLINPSSGQTNWSYILPSLPLKAGDYEGFNFMGLGIIFLFTVVLPHFIRQLRHIKFEFGWLPLFLVCLGLFLFAITNNIGIGNITLSYSLPDYVISTASALRASGRMFWPVFYLVLWYLLFLLLNNFSRKIVLAILMGALLLQVVDTRAGWGPRYEFRRKSWYAPLKSPAWEIMASRYKKIRVIPAGTSPIYDYVAYFAATHGLPTDAAYLARYDLDRYRKLLDYDSNIMHTGNYEADTLYVLELPYIDVATQHLDAKRDMVAIVDGFTVIAPAWY